MSLVGEFDPDESIRIIIETSADQWVFESQSHHSYQISYHVETPADRCV